MFLLVALLAPLGGGKDLVWKPNSNWGNPNNWASGNVPDCGESVSLRNVRRQFAAMSHLFSPCVIFVVEGPREFCCVPRY